MTPQRQTEEMRLETLAIQSFFCLMNRGLSFQSNLVTEVIAACKIEKQPFVS